MKYEFVGLENFMTMSADPRLIQALVQDFYLFSYARKCCVTDQSGFGFSLKSSFIGSRSIETFVPTSLGLIFCSKCLDVGMDL